MAQVVTQLIVDASGAKTGVAEFTAQMDKAKKAATDAGEATATSFERAQAKWTASLAKTDPVIKAQIAMEKDLARQREIGANAVKLGIATQDAAATQLDKVRQQHVAYIATLGNSAKATTELATAHKGLDAQGQAALHSIRSIGEQMALGISPVQALTGQINHLTFAATGEGGLAGAFGQVGGFIKNLISPTTAAIAGVTALGAAVAYVALQYDRVQVSSQRAIGGAGARTGTTVTDLNAFTAQNSSRLSNSEARALGEGFTSTGDIEIRRLHDMNDAVVGFANQTKQSIGDATKAFVQFGVDPQKGIQELTAAFGPLDENTRKLVESFTLAGDKTSALNVLIDATAKKAKDAADNMSLWDRINRNINKFQGQEIAKPVGIEDQLGDARDRLNTALDTGMSSNDIQSLSKAFADLQEAREKAIGQAATDNLNKLDTESERARVQVEAIAKAWGDVGTATALALNALQQQVAVASARTGQEQQAAQYAADFANASLQGKTAVEAEALSSAKLAVSQASATAAVEKQISALEDQNRMIKAAQTGTEATTAAAIAYKNAIESGADETSAAALKSQMLANSMQQAAGAAQTLDQFIASSANSMIRFQAGMEQSLAAAQAMSRSSISWQQGQSIAQQELQFTNRSEFAPNVMHEGPMSFSGSLDAGVNDIVRLLQQQATTESSGIAGLVGGAYSTGGIAGALAAIKNAPATFGADPALNSFQSHGGHSSPIDFTSILGAQRSTADEKMSTYDQLVQLQNSQTTDKTVQASNLQGEIDFLQTLPSTIARDQKIIDLTNSIQQLKDSTDSLNQTNRDALSPYYTQDPRTSHIGFRSQGMASGGWVDVPGSPSANDNMIAQIPVAGGERIYVDPNKSVRGTGSETKTQTIQITNHITIAGNASKDEVGRTGYHLAQTIAKQVATGTR